MQLSACQPNDKVAIQMYFNFICNHIDVMRPPEIPYIDGDNIKSNLKEMLCLKHL
jgi:hypothetical protein